MSKHRCGLAATLVALSGILGVLSLSPPSVQAQTCDRACLTGMMTQFINALVAHDPSKLPLAENVRYTEDSRNAKLGDGIWKSVTANGGFRQDYIDTRKQVAAAHVLLRENDTQVLYSVLLHVADMKVAGIETLVQRVTAGGKFQPTELGKPIRGMNDPVPAGRKNSREEMIRIALTYPEGLRVGNFTDGGTPFADGAYRVENGVITADQTDPRRRMYEQNIIVHPGVIPSVAAVDEENGTVLLWMNFGHTGDSYGVGNALVTFEAFKVWGGKIQSVNAFFKGLPISTGRFWPSSDPVRR
ncbi:MAG TPA: hypothetical protein VFD21_08850 [Vicinamibacterales bacterium]|jgi:hypothetical protein|nr:hypothetical protein [Vicinamibacterales bacterium]